MAAKRATDSAAILTALFLGGIAELAAASFSLMPRSFHRAVHRMRASASHLI